MISVVLNCDSRSPCPHFEGMHKGVRTRDFLGLAALQNKRKFFAGFHEIELIVMVDEHEGLTTQELDVLHANADCLIVRKHRKHYRNADPFHKFNDINFLNALSMAKGTHVAHFDSDMAAFCAGPDVIVCLMQHLEKYKFVCYPSPCTPDPVFAPEYQGQWWASTRFFLCERETLKFDVLERAIREPEWFYSEYGRPPIINPWLEAFLGVIGGYKTFYPPVELDRWAVFPWGSYRDGLMEKMNALPYPEVARLLREAGGHGIFHDGIDASLIRL